MTQLTPTRKIMSRIAEREEHRIRKMIWLVSPLFLLLLSSAIFTFYRTVVDLITQGTLEIIASLEYDWEILIPELQAVGLFVWEDVEKVILIVLGLSVLALAYLVVTTHPFSLPRLFKEIKKYKIGKEVYSMGRIALLAANLLLSVSLLVGSITPVLADDSNVTPTPRPTKTQITQEIRARNQARQEARKAYIAALKKANQDYQTAREQARGTLKTALKAAGKDKTARQTATKAYNAALKEARQAMQAAKKQALETYKATIK